MYSNTCFLVIDWFWNLWIAENHLLSGGTWPRIVYGFGTSGALLQAGNAVLLLHLLLVDPEQISLHQGFLAFLTGKIGVCQLSRISKGVITTGSAPQIKLTSCLPQVDFCCRGAITLREPASIGIFNSSEN